VTDGADRLSARLAALRSVSRALARPLDIVDVLRAVHAELARVLDVTICFFGLYDPPGQTVKVIWQVHDGVELPGGFSTGRRLDQSGHPLWPTAPHSPLVR